MASANPAPVDDPKVVQIRRDEPAAPPVVDDFETKYKARLEQDDTVKRLRERAARADEVERDLESLRAQAPPIQRQTVYRPPPPQPGPGFDVARWRETARIDPGLAYLEMEAMNSQRRAHELRAERENTVQAITSAMRYQADANGAHEFLRTELPEVFDGRSALQKRAVEIYNSDPRYQASGDGHKMSALIAAAELGIVVKSKRSSGGTPDIERDVSDQNTERGTRKPQRRGESASDDDGALSDREKRLIAKMDIDEKVYRKARSARRKGLDVKVD